MRPGSRHCRTPRCVSIASGARSASVSSETSSPDAPEERPRSNKVSYVRLLTTAAVVVGADQLAKELVLSHLSSGRVVHVIDDILTLRLTYNSGGAFGLGQGLPGLFLFATLAILAVILMMVRHIDDATWIVPLGMVLGGGVGNLSDRMFRSTGGRVVDWIDLQVWPVFNIADAAIVMGVGALMIMSFRARR